MGEFVGFAVGLAEVGLAVGAEVVGDSAGLAVGVGSSWNLFLCM